MHSYRVHPAYLRMGSAFLWKDSLPKMPKMSISSISCMPPHLRRPATAKAAPLMAVESLVSLRMVRYLMR